MRGTFDLNDSIVEWFNDYAALGILTTDADLTIHGWNKWLEQHSGRPAVETVGCRLFDVFPELVERRLDRFYQDALNGQTQVLSHRFHRYLVKLPVPSGSPLDEMQQTARVAPLMDDGRVVGTITVIEDVSERVVKEHELDAAREEAESANTAKDRFLAMLSHDLRTPLSSIIGWAKLIRSRNFEERTLETGLQSIERNAMVQLQLIEQILDISRIASGKLQLETESIDVKDVVGAVLDSVQPIADSKGIRTERMLPDEERYTAADPKRFHQIVWNLISNALKFTPKDGTVRATLIYGDEGFELSISDSGIGIAAEDLSRIFEPLWQSENIEARSGGLGLGLAIVHELVVLHGGSIRAESPGRGLGATFTVALPWASASLPTSST